MRSIIGRTLAAASLAAGLLGVGAAEAKEITIIAVTHGQASDPFWSIVKNGITAAGHDQGVHVEYRAPETFDMTAMGQLITAAVNQVPDGLIVSDPDPDALGPSIRKAVAAGIPVISINSGIAAAGSLGARMAIGQDEATAGRVVGAHMAGLGVKHALCVNHEVGNAGMDQRCHGVAEGLGGGKLTVLPTSTDPTETVAKVRAALSSDPSIDFVLGLNASLGGEPSVKAVDALGVGNRVKVGTFDLSPAFLAAVRDGHASFAVDQQPYLQGYLPVTFLAQYAKNGTMPVGNIATGPAFVTHENAGAVIAASAKGLR